MPAGSDAGRVYLQSIRTPSPTWAQIVSSGEMQHPLSVARTLPGQEITCEHWRQAGETRMLVHAGLRPLWPVMLFAPWVVLGLACLLQALRKAPGATQAIR